MSFHRQELTKAAAQGASIMHITQADLHAYADRGLTPPRREELKAHLSACTQCRQGLLDVESQRTLVAHELTAMLPPENAVPAASLQLQKLHARRTNNTTQKELSPGSSWLSWLDNPRWQTWSMWAAPLVAACFLVVMWVDRQLVTPPPTTPAPSLRTSTPRTTAVPRQHITPRKPFLGLRAKGMQLNLQVLYAAPGKRPEAASSGALLQPGGLIQFRFGLQTPRHVMILGINQRGIVFPYVPFRGTKSTLISAGKTALPKASALELDDALGHERFVLLASKTPFSLARAQRTLRHWWHTQEKDVRRPLALGMAWDTGSLLIEKRRPPAQPRLRTPVTPR